MRIFLLIMIFLCINKVTYAQMAVTDATTQINQIVIAKSQMLQTTDHIVTALQSLGVSTQMFETIKEQADKLKKINSTIKTIKKTTDILNSSYKITRMYSSLISAMSKDNSLTAADKVTFTANIYSVLGGTLELIADVTNVVTDNIFQMSDKERLDYIDKVGSKLNDNYYKMQFYAYKIASYSHSSSNTTQILNDFNTYFNF